MKKKTEKKLFKRKDVAKMYKLENWSVHRKIESWCAPEEQPNPIIVGEVYGNPDHKDGKQVQLTRVRKIEGRIITTKNSVYELGKMKEDYRQFLINSGFEIDEENPIKFVKTLTSL